MSTAVIIPSFMALAFMDNIYLSIPLGRSLLHGFPVNQIPWMQAKPIDLSMLLMNLERDMLQVYEHSLANIIRNSWESSIITPVNNAKQSSA